MHTFCLFRKKSLLWRNHLCRMEIDSGLDGTSLDGTHFLKYGAKFLLVLHGNSVTEYFCDTVSSKSANPKLVISCSCFPRLGSLISNPELGEIDELDTKLSTASESRLAENGIRVFFQKKFALLSHKVQRKVVSRMFTND